MKSTKNKNIDLGFNLLKMLMCFGVVLAHSWKNKSYDSLFFLPFKEIQIIAVPVFMLLAFYFSKSTIMSRDNAVFLKRLRKLLIPLIGWAFIYWIILEPIFHLPYKELLYQLFIGHSFLLNASMWFQFVLILLTTIYYYIFYYFKDKGLFITTIAGIISLILQFTGINYLTFKDLAPEISLAFGRILEMAPYASLGLLIKNYDIVYLLRKYRYLILIISILLLPMPYIFSFPSADGFGYSGIILIYLSLLFFIIFAVFPFNSLPTAIKKILFVISDYTLGIYCIHRLIYTLLDHFTPQLVTRTFVFSIVLYIFSYISSMLISKFPESIVKSLVK